MIRSGLAELLDARGETIYTLSVKTGLEASTLWRLVNHKTKGIEFDTLDRICEALNCTPNDVLPRTSDNAGQEDTEELNGTEL
jgi:putative transcriptional regulator